MANIVIMIVILAAAYLGVWWLVKRQKAVGGRKRSGRDEAPSVTGPPSAADIVSVRPAGPERADHPDARPIAAAAATPPVPSSALEALYIDGQEISDGTWFEKLKETTTFLFSVRAAHASPAREAKAKSLMDWDSGSPGHGTGALILAIRKVGPLPRTEGRQGSAWAKLSTKGPASTGGRVLNVEAQNDALLHYHVLPWIALDAEIAVTVRLGDQRDYPAELLVSYIPAAQWDSGQDTINCVFPLGDKSRWDLAGRQPNHEQPLP